MNDEEIMKYRQFIYEHFKLRTGFNPDGTGFAYGASSTAADLYNFLASLHK